MSCVFQSRDVGLPVYVPARAILTVKGSMVVKYLSVIFLVFVTGAMAQSPANNASQTIPLTVPAGVPLRLYLTKRVSKRLGAPVQAKLLESVYAFDREVIPAGTVVLGRVSRVEPVPKFQRAQALLGGDFTPLHRAEIEFTSIRLPDGREMAVRTEESLGLKTLYPLRPPKRKPQPQQGNTGGVLATGNQKIEDQISAKLDQVRSIPDIVRGPGKMELLSDYLMRKLPYHPQWVDSRTRFDAELRNPLDFGTEAVTPTSLLLLGSQPATDAIVHARLITPVESGVSKEGEDVQAVLSEPLFRGIISWFCLKGPAWMARWY